MTVRKADSLLRGDRTHAYAADTSKGVTTSRPPAFMSKASLAHELDMADRTDGAVLRRGDPVLVSPPIGREMTNEVRPASLERRSGHRDHAYAPRGLRREAAADWVGFSPTKFDELVKAGMFHNGKKVSGCRVWDRYLLDIEFENLPDDDESPALVPKTSAEAWSGVS